MCYIKQYPKSLPISSSRFYIIAFIPGRKIQEDLFLAQEILHAMKNKKGKTSWMALKIDMEKAYDKLEWGFLEKVLQCFGFPNSWIQ